MSHTTIYKKLNSRDVTKDGHTMFRQDIVTDLNRKSYLEVNKIELEEEKKALTKSLKQIVNLSSEAVRPLLKAIHQIAFKALKSL